MSNYDWPKLVKEARLRLGETQEKFAKRFAVATNTVSRWETGTYDLSIEAIEWILEYSLSREIRVCPRCAGKGIVCEDVSPMKGKE